MAGRCASPVESVGERSWPWRCRSTAPAPRSRRRQ